MPYFRGWLGLTRLYTCSATLRQHHTWCHNNTQQNMINVFKHIQKHEYWAHERRVKYSQLSNIIGQTWVSNGYLYSFMGHDKVADILQPQSTSDRTITNIKECNHTTYLVIPTYLQCTFLPTYAWQWIIVVIIDIMAKRVAQKSARPWTTLDSFLTKNCKVSKKNNNVRVVHLNYDDSKMRTILSLSIQFLLMLWVFNQISNFYLHN